MSVTTMSIQWVFFVPVTNENDLIQSDIQTI